MARHVLIPTLTLAFLMFAGGCSSDEGPTGASPPAGALSFETVEQSHVESASVDDDAESKFEDGIQRVIHDQSAFESFWQDLHGENADVPNVDFSEKVVVAAGLSTRPNDGYGAEIGSINKSVNPTTLSVLVTEIEPGSNCDVTDTDVIPYHIVKVDRFSAEQVSFTNGGTKTKDCG